MKAIARKLSCGRSSGKIHICIQFWVTCEKTIIQKYSNLHCLRERYRDLIQAADSIAEMKQTSESVIAKIVNVEQTFHDLQQKYLIGFKMETEQRILQR